MASCSSAQQCAFPTVVLPALREYDRGDVSTRSVRVDNRRE
jgi:hypothetical protein